MWLIITATWELWRHQSQQIECLFNSLLIQATKKKTSTLALLARCEWNSPVTHGFTSPWANNASVSISEYQNFTGHVFNMYYSDVIMRAMASQIYRHINSLLKRLFRRRWKKTSKLLVTGLCDVNSPVTGEFPTQRASNAINVSISWRHPVVTFPVYRSCDGKLGSPVAFVPLVWGHAAESRRRRGHPERHRRRRMVPSLQALILQRKPLTKHTRGHVIDSMYWNWEIVKVVNLTVFHACSGNNVVLWPYLFSMLR